MSFKVIRWDNEGQRHEHDVPTLPDALTFARYCRTLKNRTVKVGHCGDSIRHWSRTCGAKRNHWCAHSTAECSR